MALQLLLLIISVSAAVMTPVQDAAVMEASMVPKIKHERLRYKHSTDQTRHRFAALKNYSPTSQVTPRTEAVYEPMQQCPTTQCECSKDEQFFLINCRYANLNTIPDFQLINIIYDEINFGEGNRIQNIPSAAFKNLQVREIDLENNKIQTVADKAFLGLETILKKLHIQGNNINPIPYNSLSMLTNLAELKLRDFNETTIPAYNVFGRFHQLEVLELHNVSLISIDPQAFTNKLPRLNRLVFEKVPFEHLPVAGLQQLKNLSTLVIQNSQIDKVFTKSFTSHNFQSLKEITLANNKITLIEIDAFEKVCENLEVLDLMDNYLTGASYLATKLWKRLSSLNLSYNYKLGTTNMAGAFRNMPNLRHLFLENINLQTVTPDMLTGLKNLNNLKLSYNRILKIEAGAFLSSPNILEIQLDCQFCNEPNQAQQLVLSPSTFTGISQSLLNINLNESPLKADAFWKSIKVLPMLQNVFLQKTNLHEIPANAFDHNRKLQVLDLGHNGITSLSDSAFQGLQGSLRDIALDSNNLTTISKCVFKDFSQLENIKLYGNKLHCDCELIWLHDFIIKKSQESEAFPKALYTCKTPDKFKDDPIYNIPVESLTCPGTINKSCKYITQAPTKATTTVISNITTEQTTATETTKSVTVSPTKSPASLILYIGRATETSLSLSWKVYGIETPIKGFKLEYFSVIDNKKVIIPLHPDINVYMIRDLSPGLFYTVCIKAELFVNDHSTIQDCKTRETLTEKKSYEGYLEDNNNNTLIIALVTTVMVIVLVVAGLCMFMKYKLQKLKEIRLAMEPSGHRRNNPGLDYCEREESSSCTVPNEYTDIMNAKLAEKYKIYSTKEMQRQFAVDNTRPHHAYSTHSKVKRKKQNKQREEAEQENMEVKNEIDYTEVHELKSDLVQRHSAPSRLDANDLLKSGINRNPRPLPATPDELNMPTSGSSTDPISNTNHVFMTQASVYEKGLSEHTKAEHNEKTEVIYHEIDTTNTLPRK